MQGSNVPSLKADMQKMWIDLIESAIAYGKQDSHMWEFVKQEEIPVFVEKKSEVKEVLIEKKESWKMPARVPLPPREKSLEALPFKAIDFEEIPQKRQIIAPPVKDLEEKPSEEISKILQKIAPHIQISMPPPSPKNEEVVQMKNVLLLLLESAPETLDLMKNLAKALQKDLARVKLLSCKKIEEEKGWGLFFQNNPSDLIIASLGGENYPSLSAELQRKGISPVILKNASVYTNSPAEKGHLWKALCQMLKT
ncbi:MAG: hypothetical protein HYZ48_01910 [Chlamydiales bacterium]|nr:hypothetical protein [Chlamydiales bacterium]